MINIGYQFGTDNPSNCKANTKSKGYQEKMSFDWKIQFEKVQLTRDLKDDTIINQETDSFAKTTKDTAILLHEHKQQLFGSPLTPVPHFK